MLLNEVHLLMEEKKQKFLLTGSSARQLRRKGVNLLGGRARNYFLHPLTSYELAEDFNLSKALEIGCLPSIYLSDAAKLDLCSYVENYLQLEIAAEALTRNIPAFHRFLEVAALCNTQIINYSKIANDAQIAPSTAQEYFQILRDTFIGFDLPAWRESKKRKAATTSKVYFFDVGVVNSILRRDKVYEKTEQYGQNLEAFIFHELKSYTDYNFLHPLTFWRSQQKDEVDFILDGRIAIEVKATSRINKRDLKNLKKLQEEKAHKRYIVVCNTAVKQRESNIESLPVDYFLKELWNGSIA